MIKIVSCGMKLGIITEG